MCSDDDTATSLTCSAALVGLVQRSQIDFIQAVTKLVNLAPSARNLAGILTALTDLLAMQLTAQAGQGHYKCPYSIRNPPHPFVTVVTNRPDSWPLLQQQVQRLLTWPDHRVKTNALQLMEPFLKFVLLEPRQSPSFSALRTALVTGLLQGAPREMRQNIIEFLMKLLPCMQMDNTSSLGEVIMCVHSLVSYLHQHDAGHLSQIRTLSTHILALCVVAQKQGLDTGQLLEGLTTLIADHSEGVCSSSDILHLVELLSTSTERQWSSILQVLKHYTLQPMDRFLAGTLVLPLLSIIATPTSSVATQLASQVLGHVERVTASDNHPQDTSVYGHSCLRPETYSYQTYARLARHFSQNEAAAADWLTSIQSSLPNAGHVTYQLTSLVASILIVSKEQRIVGISLKVLTGLAETAMNQAPDLLPLLVYKLGRETRSEVKLEILHTMAETATHKVAIVPVLRTFQMLGMSACLKPVVLRLVTLLWKHQDRCFPHLQNMLLEKESDLASGKSLINEGLIARAASIRDICQNRPHQHGADMLVLVSAILNECTGEREAVAVAMALEGLRYLCEAEVVDIRTAWSVLAAKLQHDERSLVMCEVCRLFSLVPALEVTTREYEVFMSRAVDMLWMYTQSSDMAVASAAFQSLAKFHPSVFTIEHLPKEFHPDLEESTGSKDVDLKDVAQSRIAGDVYIRLMQSLPESLIPAYTELEKALVSHEVASVSRSILHTRTARTANPNKAFAAIPECIQSRYDRNPPPELRPSLAIGLLLSYDPLVPVGRDGKPRKQHIVQHGRSFHQMFYTLMNEVTMSLTEWNELLLLPQAWTLFMQRCFSAYLEGYTTELVLQLEQGQVDDLEENQLHQDTAWLWTRDKLFDLIKSTSRGRPAVQANAVFALAGLATTVAKYANTLNADATAAASKVTEHLGMPHWLSMVLNTILSILDVNFKPTSRIFQICQQRGSHDSNPSPLPARAAAALAISELIPIVATTDTAMVGRILETLSGFISTETSSGLPLSLSLGLGLTVTRLFDEHFLDIAGTQGMVSVWKAVDQLEKTAFGMTEGSVGSMIGVTLCLVSMCREGAAANIAHVRSMQEQLAMALEFATASDSNYQALCQCVASVTASAYASNIVTHQDTDHLVAKLYTAHVTDIQSVSLCAALGTLCHGLMVAGHSTVTDMVDSLITKWMSALTNEEAPTLQRTASLKGLMALTESHPLSQVQGDDSQSRLPLGQLIMSLGRLLQKSCDPVIQSQCATVLGQLYMGGSTSATDLRSAVPNTYHYLGDDSVLRSVVDVLIEAGKLGPEATNICCVEACVKSLVLGGATSQVLPPVNWASIFTPLLRMPFGSEVEKACLQVAVQQSAAVPSAALLLSSWLLPPLYDSLHGSGRVTLLESLLTLVMTVPVQKLTEFFKQGFHQSVMDHSPGVDCDSLNLTALRGLWGALRVHAPPPAITKLLYQTLQETFALWTDASSWNVDERTALCRCLTEVPDEVIDEILQTSFASPNQTASAMFVRCYLVSMGSQPLSWLNASIEASVCNTDMTEGGILWLLMQSFRGSHLSQDKQANVPKRLHWLLELMGYMKGIMVGTVGVSDLHRSADQILEALMLVFAAAVVTWAGSEVSLPLAVSSFGSWDEQEPSSLLAELLPRILPHALHVLLGSQPWAASTGKVIDWLLALHETMIARNSANLLMLIKQCLYNLRHSQAFDKTNTWTVVFSLS